MKAVTLSSEGKVSSGICFTSDTDNRVNSGSRYTFCHDNLVNSSLKFNADISKMITEMSDNLKEYQSVDNSVSSFIKSFKQPKTRFFRAELRPKHEYRNINILVPDREERDEGRLLLHFCAGSQKNAEVTSLCHENALIEAGDFYDASNNVFVEEKLMRLRPNSRVLFKCEYVSPDKPTQYFLCTWSGEILTVKPIKGFRNYDRFSKGKLEGTVEFNVELEEYNTILEESKLFNKIIELHAKRSLAA